MEALLLLFLLIGLVVLWLLPGIVASSREHPNAVPIWIITIFLGWTLIGWVIALAWSATAVPPKPPAPSVPAPSPTPPTDSAFERWARRRGENAIARSVRGRPLK
jgi:hypothetical protein